MDKLSKRNVVDMTDYRADEGFSALGQVEGYWEALRGNRLLPKRCEIDPRGIESALEYTFVLERIAIGMARMRIAGSHLNNLMGMEVRGMPLTSFIAPNGRAKIGEVLEEVFQRPAACELFLSAEVGRKKPPMEARMLLLPLTSDLGDVSRVLGCFVARGDMGEKPRRFEVSSIKMRALTATHDDDVQEPVLATVERPNSLAGFEEQHAPYQGRPMAKKPYLRLITST
jgi:hypothetical protein